MISNAEEFQKRWIKKLNQESLKNFPDDFIGSFECNLFPLPAKPLIKGSEIFGQIEIIDLSGTPIHSSNNHYKIKYILYSNRNMPSSIKIPIDESVIEQLVRIYEKHVDELLKEMERDYISIFSNSDRFDETANKIFQIINLQRY